jgi:metal-responsive CopG/Arc/MetJ family transcriptional regulator
MMDAELLAALDSTMEVQELGRSAVLRQAAGEYLARQRRSEIREGYQRAYGDRAGLGEELTGWEDEGFWPSD